MYGRITLRVRLGEQTVIPASGVLRTGMHNVAFIDRGDGSLIPKNVELGPRVGDDLVVLNGLLPGQRIVASANFLIDSESQLQAATGSFLPAPEVASASAASLAAKRSATIEVLTIPNPPVRGKNRVRVTLKDANGLAIDGAKVSVSFYMPAMPEMGMSALREVAAPRDRGGGVYEGSVGLESGGTWQVTALATKEGRTLASMTFSLSASGGM
jgi:Cu(I)/Ag(I) efflux system membrane fusion protein/cobalt-zinc-cadmium efflux system membrane fusion protein